MASQSSPPPSTALAPGFRFHPTDEELVSYYLKRKVSNKPILFSAISEVDIYKHEPWDLADKARLKNRDQEWYFFSALDRKYGNGARVNRSTNEGYWKATGKDRDVRRGSQIVAMKKTLVFHSGRAPGGHRTDWVMHEYRLVDEELDKIQTDTYVLCRVFHKNNIGPPTGNRYAPFIDEEWDDGENAFIPGEAALDVEANHENCSQGNHVEQDNDSIHRNPLNMNELPSDTANFNEPEQENSVICKTEREDNCPRCLLNTEAPFPILQYKRRKHNDDTFFNGSNATEKSTRTTQEHCSSATSTGNANATTTAVSALLEFSLMESIEPKERHSASSVRFDAGTFGSSVHPSLMKLINDLQSEVQKISIERETLKLELMSAQAMMNILQSQLNYLSKENEDLKASMGGRSQV